MKERAAILLAAALLSQPVAGAGAQETQGADETEAAKPSSARSEDALIF